MIRALPWVALLVLAGCKKEKPNPDLEFWNWVRAHTAELKAVKTGQEPVLTELGHELEKAAPGLTFELGAGADPFEFVISADGLIERFDAVMRLTASAGDVPGMKVVAFRQRKKIDGLELQIDDQKIPASSVLFVTAKDRAPGKTALELYLDGYDDQTAASLQRGAFLLLDTVIGEFDMETKIGEVRFHATPAPEGAKPLPTLAAELDASRK